jgi:hypothetical protein
MVEDAAHPCNFDLQGVDTPLLGFVRHNRGQPTKRAKPHASWGLSGTGHSVGSRLLAGLLSFCAKTAPELK